MGEEATYYDPWEPTPWWHPRRWFGHSWRRLIWDADSIGGPYDGSYEYMTTIQFAQYALDNTFGG